MKNFIQLNLFPVICYWIVASSCFHVKEKNTLEGNSVKTNVIPEWAMGGFKRSDFNPIIAPASSTNFTDPVTKKMVLWESGETFNPGAIVKDDKIILLYRAEAKTIFRIGRKTSRLGYAESFDGIHFTRKAIPVLFPAEDEQKEFEWPGGCEDPRLVMTEDSTYFVFYTQWNRDVPRLGIATSKDLISWEKHGPIFKKFLPENFSRMPNKSASVVTKISGGRQVIAKVRGKYIMYWGEGKICFATSDNLFDWQPLLGNSGTPVPLLSPRTGYFDSDLVECGPPALITDEGILLIYNAKNNGNGKGDKRFNDDAYAAGEVLFDINEPTKVLERLDVPFLRPLESFEKSGQYAPGTVFAEGLVYFKEKWFLYYGCADSRVAVAVFDPKNPASPDPLPVSVE